MARWQPSTYAAIPADQRAEYFKRLDEEVTNAIRDHEHSLRPPASLQETNFAEYVGQMNMAHLMAEEAGTGRDGVPPAGAGPGERERGSRRGTRRERSSTGAGSRRALIEISDEEWAEHQASGDWQPLRRPPSASEAGDRALAAGEWRARSARTWPPRASATAWRPTLPPWRSCARWTTHGRSPSADEQAVLARWSAWGSLPKVFDPAAGEFADARAQVQDLLGEDEWRAAARTTLNAHYTDFDVACAMWRAVEAAGFAGGRVLEPGVGSGTFLATAPAHLAIEAVGVEIDPVTARIAAALHPHASIRAESFAVTRFPDGWFDLTIGNVPFGDYKLFDPIYNRAGHSVHNHFIAKSLRLTRPGGYVAVLTSRFTLDARSSAARRDLAELADLVGAVRLPEGTMRRVAGTGVAMDLVVLRRREPGARCGARPGSAWPRWPRPMGPWRSTSSSPPTPTGCWASFARAMASTAKTTLRSALYLGLSCLVWRRPWPTSSVAPSVRGSRCRRAPVTSAIIGSAGQAAVTDARRGPHHVEGSFWRPRAAGSPSSKTGSPWPMTRPAPRPTSWPCS